jgi:hypothetical protein
MRTSHAGSPSLNVREGAGGMSYLKAEKF